MLIDIFIFSLFMSFLTPYHTDVDPQEANGDMNPVMEKLDCAMPRDTVIVGDERGCFIYRSGNAKRNIIGSLDAIALVFAQDRDRSSGNIKFHVALSNGVSPVGTTYKAASVRTSNTDCSTWLTAKREGQQQLLDGQSILDDINNLVRNFCVCIFR
ncbi:hypothetical protein Ahy_A08g041209 [Arachis hypogaea]|uniref:Uncharacterized protein n=1 Tax=Arachis hypogaea TaxID=3818 RepID=A0A445C200_ARAHY|nr:hypothetical protein Ahy_A08g041209 [Arachis hypogaea]